LKTIARFLSLILLITIAACSNQPQNKQKEKSVYVSDTQLTAALGKWQRTDGGYVLEINNLKSDSTLEAAYFNPNPINVSETHWKTQRGYLYIFVKFDDEGYPGSYYSLGYYPEEDRLYGFYFQAVQQEKFDVVFERK